MNFSNSSYTVSSKELSSPKNEFQSFIQYHKLIFIIIIIVLSMICLSIITFLYVARYRRRKKKAIQRQKVIFRKQSEPKLGAPDDPSIMLIEKKNDKTPDNVGIISSDDIHKMFLPNSISRIKLSNILADTPRESTISVSSQHISGASDNDDLSNFNLTDVPLHRLPLSKNNLADQSLLQASPRSSNDKYEHPYITELKKQQKEKAGERKQYLNSQISISSKTSEKSCF